MKNDTQRLRSQQRLFAIVIGTLLLSLSVNFYLLVTRVPLGNMLAEKEKIESIEVGKTVGELTSRVEKVIAAGHVDSYHRIKFSDGAYDEVASMKNVLERSEPRIRSAAAALQSAKDMLRMMEEYTGNTYRVSLTPDSAYSSGDVSILWSPLAPRAVLVANGLRALDAGHSYQLWYIRGTSVIPGEIFSPSAADGKVIIPLTGFTTSKAEAVALSVERSEGVWKPTTALFSMTALSN